jgi:hypothetical protein
MMKSRRRRNNKQTPFYAFTEDGKVYAGNRKARRIAYSQKAIVKNQSPPTQAPATVEALPFDGEGVTSGFSVPEEETDGNNNSSSI